MLILVFFANSERLDSTRSVGTRGSSRSWVVVFLGVDYLGVDRLWTGFTCVRCSYSWGLSVWDLHFNGDGSILSVDFKPGGYLA
jgi:hypothetical protein